MWIAASINIIYVLLTKYAVSYDSCNLVEKFSFITLSFPINVAILLLNGPGLVLIFSLHIHFYSLT